MLYVKIYCRGLAACATDLGTLPKFHLPKRPNGQGETPAFFVIVFCCRSVISMIVAYIFVNNARRVVNKTHHVGVIFGVWGIKKEVKMRPGPPQEPLRGPRSDFR